MHVDSSFPVLPPMPFHSDRTLLKALIVSLLAHAFLLLETPRLLPVRPEVPSAAITVSMQRTGNGTPRPPVRAPETKAAEKPAASKTPEQKKKTSVLAVPDQPSTSAVSSPPVASTAEPDAIAVPSAAAPAKGSASGSVGGSVPADTRLSGPGSQPPRQEGINADEVRQYRTSLAISAKPFKRYPALARERGWEGNVEIVLDFRRLRPDPEVSVASSSGRTVLDDQALEMIRRAVRVTDLPASLKGQDFRVLVPIRFNLNDER